MSMQSEIRHRVLGIALLVLALAAAGACSRGQIWSADEEENSRHFWASLAANDKATQLIGKNNPDAPQFGVDEINQYQRTALNEAKLVQDSVLEKAHPELREHFRSEYQKGLELILSSYKVAAASPSGPPLTGQIDLQASGVTLLKQWAIWLDAHGREIKMPEQSPSAARRDESNSRSSGR